jgi:16S rRNA (cytidine1402-2'-O)-methyltransferase
LSKIKPKNGRLYVVSTPIGNFNDISIRALNVLREADLVLCENFKEAAALLKYFGLEKELDSITVKNEDERYPEFILMLEEGKTIALVSDCGTPAFADPGSQLINSAINRDIDVQVLPGATSIMTALVRCGFSIERFFFAGFLPRTSPERTAELRKLSKMTDTFCLLETPYRLIPLLEDAIKIMPDRKAYLACNLTMKNETHHYGTIQELYDKFKDKKVKMEFVLVVEGNAFAYSPKEFEKDNRRQKPSKDYAQKQNRRGNASKSYGDKRDKKKSFARNDRSSRAERKNYDKKQDNKSRKIAGWRSDRKPKMKRNDESKD